MFYRIFFFLCLLCNIISISAQQQYAQLSASSNSSSKGFTIIFPENLLSAEYIIIDDIEFEGNNTTHEQVLFREITFDRGDTLRRDDLSALLENSRQNLLNTSLFNFVEISLLFDELLPQASVKFTFVERWYIWPFPVFEIAERNFNDWAQSPSLRRVNYGMYVLVENFRGRMERLRILLRAGYKQNYSLGYTIPYINGKQNIGMGFQVGLNRRREIVYMTRDNIQLFYTQPDGFALQQFYAVSQLFYRKGIHIRHNLHLEFNQYTFADSILQLNPLYSPGSATRAPFFSIGYDFRNDHRDVKAYPLKGRYFDIRIKKHGLGLLRNEEMDITTVETSVRKYWQLDKRWYFSSGINAKVSFGDFKPYYLQQGLGFRGDLVRGYENFVIDGQHFGVLKTNLKYALLPQRTDEIGFIRNEKFSKIHYAIYANVFADIGYVRDRAFFINNPYSNQFLAGYGVGIDFVTYYDKVIRSEFSFTRQGDMGFHLHLIAPI